MPFTEAYLRSKKENKPRIVLDKLMSKKPFVGADLRLHKDALMSIGKQMSEDDILFAEMHKWIVYDGNGYYRLILFEREIIPEEEVEKVEKQMQLDAQAFMPER